MILFRKIIFLIFLAAYLLLCPLLILYSLGYIFNPVNKEVTQTGLIYLSSKPFGANVFLGKSRFLQRTPANIQELLPGTYDIKVQLKDHRIWKQRVNVIAGKAAAFKDILLLPNTLNVNSVIADNFKAIIPIEHGNTFLLSKGMTLADYFVFDRKTETVRHLIPADHAFASFPVISVFSDPAADKHIVYGGSLFDKRCLLLTKNNNAERVIDIGKFFTRRPQNIHWDSGNDPSVFVLFPGYVDRLDIETQGLYPQMLSDIRGFGLYKGRLAYLDAQGAFRRMSAEKARYDIPGEYIFDKELFDPVAFYEINFLTDNLILFLSNKGQLLINIAPYQVEEGSVRGYSFNKDAGKLLYWTKGKIAFVNFSAQENRDSALGEGFFIQTLYEGGRNIEQCMWVDQAHVILRDNNEISLIEIEPQGENHIEPLIRARPGSAVFFSDIKGCLYYLDEQGGNLCSIEIIPKENVGVSFIHEEK